MKMKRRSRRREVAIGEEYILVMTLATFMYILRTLIDTMTYSLQCIRMDCTLLQFPQVPLDKWVEVCFVSHQTV